MANYTNKTLLIILTCSLLAVSCSKKTLGLRLSDSTEKGLPVKEFDFEYLSGKAKINFKDEEFDVKAKANLRMRKDSVIWITFSAVGIQGARCLINKDSITLMNILKKEYYVFKYEELSEKFNLDVNFEAIQAVALGNLLVKDQLSDLESENDRQLLKQRIDSVIIHNYINPNTKKIESIEMLQMPTRNTATIRYSQFQMVDHEIFPFVCVVSLFYKTADQTLNTLIDIEYSKLEIEDKALKFPFNIPKKYERK